MPGCIGTAALPARPPGPEAWRRGGAVAPPLAPFSGGDMPRKEGWAQRTDGWAAMKGSTLATTANRASKRGSWPPLLGTLTARIALALLWGWAGCSKIRSPEASVEAVRVYRVLPESLLAPVGYGLPALELALAALLLLGLRIRLAAVLSAGLLVAFIAGITQAGIRGLSIDCGCLGGGGEVGATETQYAKEIVRDLLFLCASAWLIRRPASRYALDNHLG